MEQGKKMNDIVAVDTELLNKLDAMNDDGKKSSAKTQDGTTLPILKVDYGEDNDGKLHININGEDHYSDTVWFRPLINSFKWSHYDFDKKEMMVETIEVRNIFQEEPIDTRGTLRCGKPPSKNLDEEGRAKWKHIVFNRIIRGLVDVGEHTNIPCIMFLKGASRDTIEETYLSKLAGSHHMRDYKVAVSTKRAKRGSVNYWVVQFAPDFEQTIPVDQPTVETIQVMTSQIEERNKAVREKYTQKLKDKNLDNTSIDALKDALEDEFKEAS